VNGEQKTVVYPEYKVFLGICLLFMAAAFVLDSPADIWRGLGQIYTARGVMASDSIAIGGLGAALVNAVLLGLYAAAILLGMRVKPGGAAIMTLWMSAGWTFIGATVLNTLPLTLGVWLFARIKKKPFSDFMIPAILCHTISPIAGKFYFSNPVMLHVGGDWHPAINIASGVLAGLACGFVLPVIASAAQRMHGGFTLYNMGVVGGMVAMFAAAAYGIAGIEIPREPHIFAGQNTEIAVFLFVVWAALIVIGIAKNWRAAEGGRPYRDFINLLKQTGFAPNDFYQRFGGGAYVNMGLLGILGTALVLAFGAELNGITLAALFSMVAFGGAGKHIRNVLPLMAGCILCVYVAGLDMSASMATVLFSTCLAPIAGKFGWIGGAAAGVVHVMMVTHAGHLTGGMNLYNNGFVSGFVAFFVVPVLSEFVRGKKYNPSGD